MKVRNNSRGWMGFALSGLLALGLAAPAGLLLDWTMPTPASANSELHPGGRLFYPAWDVRGARVNFMIITRLAMFPGDQDADGQLKRAVKNTDGVTIGYTYDTRNNCQPYHNTARPTFGTTVGGTFVNVPGTNADPVDDVHLEFYGKSCDADDEVIKMSCADIDLIFLSAGNLSKHAVLGDTQGSLDVHFIVNGQTYINRVEENSLMGYGVIADPTEGWVAAYPAAAAKATYCPACSGLDGGTDVGYEPFPSEVFIPYALVDDSQGGLINELYLWAPSFFPGDIMPDSFAINWDWYDGRERRFNNSRQKHVYIEPLKTLDQAFQHSTFTCGHATTATVAENDGIPKVNVNGTNAVGGCSAPESTDATHQSDNTQTELAGFTSTSIGWWDIAKVGDTAGLFPNNVNILATRGMVGVIIARTDVTAQDKKGNGDAIRLWHKDPCEIAPKLGIGPAHVRDRAVVGDNMVLFNTNNVGPSGRLSLCGLGSSLPQ